MNSKIKVQLLGAFIFLLGIGGTGYVWYHAITSGMYSQKASFFFPFFAFLGLSILLYPMTKEESLIRYGSEDMPWKHFPLGQKVLIVLGVVLGLLQWAIFSGKIQL